MSDPVIIGDATLYMGDCLEVMRQMPDNSVDSIVTDPPYGIRFMGKAWDGADIVAKAKDRANYSTDESPRAGATGGHRSIAAEAGKYDMAPAAMLAFQQFSQDWAREAIRVLKPGGYLLCFASTRTYHRMASGVEDAGFEIRDQIGWTFGSGFPKSHNLDPMSIIETRQEFVGWGTALKPAWEPICMARKPLIGTVAANVTAHSTGALNIDGCRIGAGDDRTAGGPPTKDPAGSQSIGGGWANDRERATGGRWPANLILDGSDEVLALFPQSDGQAGAVTGNEPTGNGFSGVVYGHGGVSQRPPSIPRNDTGSAARFFYCAKASQADRNEGCDGLPERTGGMVSNTSGQHITRRDGGAPGPRANHHPTVKPTDLMRYLCRLVTPPGGIVLDPFMGSGSTGRAAVLEGFQFVGIEREADYVAIARARIDSARRQGHQPSLDLEPT